MVKAFLDPNRPLITCAAATCNDCPAGQTVHCHFSAKDLFYFWVLVLPAFLLGSAGICHFGAQFLVPWLVIMVGYFGLAEIRVMCAHCPHYAEPGDTLKCWANYGFPKLWRYRPDPMSSVEKMVFWGGLATVFGYPLLFLAWGKQWLLLIIYALATMSMFLVMKRQMCTHCMNFACPLNVVAETVKGEFFKRNPEIAQTWGADVVTLPKGTRS